MNNHFNLSDEAFEEAFRNCMLDPKRFDHTAHLRLAWIHVHKYGIDSAIENICIQLKDYIKYLGVEDTYNATVTIAAIRAVYHFKFKSESDNFSDFKQEFPRLVYGFKTLLGSHYKTDIFNSDAAKKNNLELHLLPFD